MLAKLTLCYWIPQNTPTKTHQDFNITLNDTLLERVKYTRFLGVLYDHDDDCLTWKNHIDVYQNNFKEYCYHE